MQRNAGDTISATTPPVTKQKTNKKLRSSTNRKPKQRVSACGQKGRQHIVNDAAPSGYYSTHPLEQARQTNNQEPSARGCAATSYHSTTGKRPVPPASLAHLSASGRLVQGGEPSPSGEVYRRSPLQQNFHNAEMSLGCCSGQRSAVLFDLI